MAKALTTPIVIGETETSDPAWHPEWIANAITKKVDGVTLITKNLTPRLREDIMMLPLNNIGCIVHATCTGWGNTFMEPGVPLPRTQSENVIALIEDGFPVTNLVWRCDPIIPTEEGYEKMELSISALKWVNKQLKKDGYDPITRIRISIIDNYKHVQERFAEANLPILYNGYFFAPTEIMVRVRTELEKAITNNFDYPVIIELCAEGKLYEILKKSKKLIVNNKPCVNVADIRLMGLPQERIDVTLEESKNKKAQRTNCSCVRCKIQLCNMDGQRCRHKCLYCYMK